MPNSFIIRFKGYHIKDTSSTVTIYADLGDIVYH